MHTNHTAERFGRYRPSVLATTATVRSLVFVAIAVLLILGLLPAALVAAGT